MRRLAQGHPDTQLGGAGDRTLTLPVTSQPTLPPVLSRPQNQLLVTVCVRLKFIELSLHICITLHMLDEALLTKYKMCPP